jgi:hypothetical protein
MTTMIGLLAIPAEFLLGLILGFFLSDKQDGLTFDDIKLSLIAFLLVNAFVLWQYPAHKGIIFAALTIGWLAVNLGMLFGVITRRIMVRKVVSGLSKKDIQSSICDYIKTVRHYAYGLVNDRGIVDMKNQGVREKLDLLCEQSLSLSEDKGTSERINQMTNLCDDYLSVAHEIKANEDTVNKTQMLEYLSEKGDAIVDLSWNTLNHTENEVKAGLRKIGTTKVVRMSLKSH